MREYLILHMSALLTGVLLDLLIGDPAKLPHPIRLIGSAVAHLEKHLYKDNEKTGNVVRGGILAILTASAAFAVSALILTGAYMAGRLCFFAVHAVMTFYVLAARCLRDEAYKVYRHLKDGDIEGASSALSMIVGRDTAELDEAGIIRAAVETVAENTSDGVIAALICTAAGGPALGMCYKAVNTMDSMIGYRNERYEYFGKIAARADDVLNLIPSRLSAILMIISAFIFGLFQKDYSGKGALRIWLRDRYAHKSPNSGQTESACAGALGLRLSGDASYGGIPVRKPYIGDDTRPPEPEDIRRAVRLMFLTEGLCTAAILLTGSILIFP